MMEYIFEIFVPALVIGISFYNWQGSIPGASFAFVCAVFILTAMRRE